MPILCQGPYLNWHMPLSGGPEHPLHCFIQHLILHSVLHCDPQAMLARTCTDWVFLCSLGATACSPPAGANLASDTGAHTPSPAGPRPYSLCCLRVKYVCVKLLCLVPFKCKFEAWPQHLTPQLACLLPYHFQIISKAYFFVTHVKTFFLIFIPSLTYRLK